MRIVDLKQRTPDWAAWRAEGVAASDAPVLWGSPFKSPWRLWTEKTGRVLEADLSGNPHVTRGIEQETPARQVFEERHDVVRREVA